MDSIKVVSWIVLPVAGVIFISFFTLRERWLRSIDTRLTRWRSVYGLTDETVREFKEIELEFHGTGNPLTTPIRHSPEEVQRHHEHMATLLSKEMAEKFLHDAKSGRLAH